MSVRMTGYIKIVISAALSALGGVLLLLYGVYRDNRQDVANLRNDLQQLSIKVERAQAAAQTRDEAIKQQLEHLRMDVRDTKGGK